MSSTIMTVASAARVRLCAMILISRRQSGANKMAKIVPHRTAPKKGQRIHAKASDMTTTRNRNVLSSRLGKLIEFGDFIEGRGVLSACVRMPIRGGLGE